MDYYGDNQPTQVILKSGGPAYRDPKEIAHQQMNEHLHKVLSGKSKEQRMDQFVDQICNDFEAYAEKDNVITVEEFAKFEILYNSSMQDKYLKRQLTMEELDHITELSDEFKERFNLQRPTHIVDHTGKEVCPPLPPVMTKLSFLHGKLAEALDTFHTTHVNDDGQAGGMNAARKIMATNNLFQTFAKGQNSLDILNQQEAFRKQADQLKNFVYGDTSTIPTQSAPSTTTNSIPTTQLDDVEYAPVDDD